MTLRASYIALLLLGISQPTQGRLVKHWTYRELFDKSDLVVIAAVVSSKDTQERTTLPDYNPGYAVVGVTTEFESRVVLKGRKEIERFQLHHYRHQFSQGETEVTNAPELIKTPLLRGSAFLMFLIQEPDGNYAPVAGQVDPGIFSVLELKGGAD